MTDPKRPSLLSRVRPARLIEGLPSLKGKLSIVIVAAVAVTAGMSLVGLRFGWPIWLRPVIAGVVALAMVQVLARGLTRPLGEMASAVEAMAGGTTGRGYKPGLVGQMKSAG